MRWVPYNKDSRPSEYGTYFVYRAEKIHKEVWNNTGWAYNNNTVTHWCVMETPEQQAAKREDLFQRGVGVSTAEIMLITLAYKRYNKEGEFRKYAQEILSKKRKGTVVGGGTNYTAVQYQEAIDAMEEFFEMMLDKMLKSFEVSEEEINEKD